MARNNMQIEEEHGCAYFMTTKEFCCAPLLKGGGIDLSSWSLVEESPEHYKEDHRRILEKLGEDPEPHLAKISYYKEE